MITVMADRSDMSHFCFASRLYLRNDGDFKFLDSVSQLLICDFWIGYARIVFSDLVSPISNIIPVRDKQPVLNIVLQIVRLDARFAHCPHYLKKKCMWF